MAISATTLGILASTAGATAYGVALDRAPAANTLVIVDIFNTDTGGTISLPSSVSGAGLVFSLITSSVSFNPFTAGSQAAIVSSWRGMGATPDGSLITCAGMGSGNNLGCAMIVTEYSGVSTSGTSGENAVGQSSDDSATASATLLVDNGPTSAASTANGWHCTVGRAGNSVAGFADSYVSLGVGGFNTPNSALFSAWTTNSSTTTLEWTFGSSVQHASVLFELVADNPAAGGDVISPYYASYYYPRVVAE